MSKILVLSLVALSLAACKAPITPEAIGKHNLSKGRCTDIPLCDTQGQCRQVNDESVKYVCDMVGGSFEPRELKKQRWLF